jgi:hypothetical protein
VTIASDELLARFEEAMREQRVAMIDDLGVRSMLWLAAPPLWTRTVAETTGFPVESESVTEFVRRACDAGWCKIHGSLRTGEQADLCFWMPDEVRGDVLDTLRELPGGDLRVVHEAQQVAAEMNRSADRVDLPGALQAWVELFADVEPAAVSANLVEHVRQAVSANLVENVRQAVDEDNLSRAQEFVAAGAALEPMVAGTARHALHRARRMLDLGRHRRADEQALSRYLDRPQLSDAVASLLAPHTNKWALHLRGAGGVGKSMLIRYLRSGKFAEIRNLQQIPITCVNFDHVSPDYPDLKPVQLLLELADELAPYVAASDQADRALRAFYDEADSAHQALSSLRDGGTRPLDNPDVHRAVDAFADVINELDGVLLILDTCEELAKWNPGSPNSPAIRATLEIVERLHEQAGSVRVLLAGRRSLPAREWMDERSVAGFTVAEARQYLALPEDRTLAADLAAEIIRQSRAVDEPVPAAGELPACVNPFDLALYRAWANEEPDLSVAEVQRGNDAYVESRIIQRLDDPLVMNSLPILAAGGKCRVETIAMALNCDAASLGVRLATQEWVNVEGGSPPVFVMAWPSMAERLRRYYQAADRLVDFLQVMHWFAEVLRRRFDDDPLASIDVDEVVAALRWAEQPAGAARLWDSITARAAQPPGRWGAMGAITLRILGLWEEEEWPTTGALRAAVLAAHIAAYRRDTPLADVREQWEQVLARAAEHPDPARQRQLRALGALGALPYHPERASSLWDVLRTEQGSLMSSPEVGTAAIDAVHRLLEAGHVDGARQLQELLDLDSFRTAFRGYSGAGRVLRSADADWPLAWARVAEGRLLADSDPSAARERLTDAERLAFAGSEWEWPQWVPPEDLLARVRIERGLIDQELIATPSGLTVLGAWEQYAHRHLRSIDGERLASLCLRLRLRHGAVPASEPDRWESADRYVRGRAATNSAHDLVPPLFVSVAEAWLSAGQPERGLALLERRRSEANAARDDDATVRHADAGIVGLARRLRLTDQRSLLVRLTSPAEYHSAPRNRIGTLDNARRAWAVIYRESPPDARAETDRLAGWHAWWQCQPAAAPEPAPRVPWSPGIPNADQVGLLDIQADLKEMRLLERLGLEQVRRQLNALLDPPEQTSRRSLTPARSADPYRAQRLDLRWAALDGLRFTPPSTAPVRVIAEMAFEEAELLALRLPAAAARICWEAADAYATCSDHIGRLLALAAFHDMLSGCSAAERSSVFGALSASSAAAQTALLDAWDAIAAHHPGLAAILAGPPDKVGSWQYWAQAAQRSIGDLFPAMQAGTGSSSVSPVEVPEPTATARNVPDATAILRAVSGILALPLVVVLAGRTRAAFRLAAGRGVGAVPVETLIFDATIGEAAPAGTDDMVRLRVRLRPWRSAPVQAWSRLRLRAITLAVWLLRFGWPRQPTGYSGFLAPQVEPSDEGGISWTPRLDSPRGTWWEPRRQAPVAGTIRTSRSQAGQPWERILATSLGPAAAGRIEWVRLTADQVRPLDSGHSGAELIAAPGWDRALAEYYRRPESSADPGVARIVADRAGPASSGVRGPRVRHVVGRAVRTSAGPCMNVSGDSGPGRAAYLLAAGDLIRDHPLVVVLQTEPAGEEGVGTVRPYDLADKLRLATALLEDSVPAVIVLPTLPAYLAREVARIVTAFADAPGLSGKDVGVTLLRPLRTAIAPHVEPGVLDNIILFLNAGYA